MPKEEKKFLGRHYDMMRRRGLTPKNYTLIAVFYAPFTAPECRPAPPGSRSLPQSYFLAKC